MGRYCWRCGQQLPARPPIQCPYCGQGHYATPTACGEAVVEHDGQVLLVSRANDPWKHCWDIPGGFCNAGEHPRIAAQRELLEETGLAADAVAYIGTWMDDYGPPELDGTQATTANVAYLMRLRDPSAALVLPPEEVRAAAWFALDAPPLDLAFPRHSSQVLAAAEMLRRRTSMPPMLDDVS